MKDEQVKVRRLAARMLGEIRAEAEEVISSLIDALKDCDVLVRRCSAQALAGFGPAAKGALERLAALLDEDEWTRVFGAEAILSIDPDRTEVFCPILASALRSRSVRIRCSAIRALERLPVAAKMAVPDLIQALADDEERVRLGALWTLEGIGPAASPAVPALIDMVQVGNDLLIRGTAATVLGNIGPEAHAAMPFLLCCLQETECDSSSRFFRLQVARAVWQIGRLPNFLLAVGIEALADLDWQLRQVAAMMLGELGSAAHTAIPHLAQAIKDECPTVRLEARRALKKITGR